MVSTGGSTLFKITTIIFAQMSTENLKVSIKKNVSVKFEWRSEGGAVVRAPKTIVGAICGMSLLLVLSFGCSENFSLGYSGFSTS